MDLIYISGIDGCGKTTQAKLLVDWLYRQGLSAEYQWLRWEPSIRYLTKSLRVLLRKTSSPLLNKEGMTIKTENHTHGRWTKLKKKMFSSSLFCKLWIWYASYDYLHSYNSARGKWKSDYIVLDRYLLDLVIDQSINLSLDPNDFLAKLSHTKLKTIQQPTFSIVIDLPAEVGYHRKLDGTPLQYLQDRESLYKRISFGERALHVDGTRSEKQIHQDITIWLTKEIGGLQ